MKIEDPKFNLWKNFDEEIYYYEYIFLEFSDVLKADDIFLYINEVFGENKDFINLKLIILYNNYNDINFFEESLFKQINFDNVLKNKHIYLSISDIDEDYYTGFYIKNRKNRIYYFDWQ